MCFLLNFWGAQNPTVYDGSSTEPAEGPEETCAYPSRLSHPAQLEVTGRGCRTPSTRSRLMPPTGSLVFLHLLTTHPPPQCHTKATWLSPPIDTAPRRRRTGTRPTQNQENPRGQRTPTCSLQESPPSRLGNPDIKGHPGYE